MGFEKLLAVSCQLSARRRNAGRSRRGVLLLVVLSMLVLFMLIGTAFLMTSSATNDKAKIEAKVARLDKSATKRIEGALMKVVRDTDDPNSTIRYHSLLRDLYGTDGFQAVIYSPMTVDLTTSAGQLTRYAGADATTGVLGPTQGQFVDLYVGQTIPNASDTLNLQNVIKLDRNGLGQPQLQLLPQTKGYYNGCLLTITSGPAVGQSTRILEYEFIPPEFIIGSGTSARTVRIFRFRVMNFPLSSGGALVARAQLPTTDPRTSPINQRGPELVDLVLENRNSAATVVSRGGQSILVNGRPFSGTGVGYNPLAIAGRSRLNAVQTEPLFGTATYIGEEVALTPNSRYFNPATVAFYNLGSNGVDDDGDSLIDELDEDADPFLRATAITSYTPLNTTTRAGYGWFPGLGGVNEDYDAPDFQNMILGMQTVTPRNRGRVVQDNGSGTPITFELDNPNLWDGLRYLNTDKFLRLDLEDVPLPSLHRPDLINFWYHRLLNSEWLTTEISNVDDRAKAIFQPYDANWNLAPWLPNNARGRMIAAQIAALKRKISMRPIREDHPHFDGSNSASVPIDLSQTNPVAVNGLFAIPYWEAVGPWDVDNDNDGVAESVWVDLGDPVQEAEDGTRYKALFAIHVVDLDSKLNVNANGLVDHINPANLAIDYNPSTGAPYHVDNLAGTTGNIGAATTNYSTDQLAPGIGFSPAEISLRPVFSIPLTSSYAPYAGNRVEDNNLFGGSPDSLINASDAPVDSYSTLLAGRTKIGFEGLPGRYGYQWPGLAATDWVAPGLNYRPDNSTGFDRVPELTTLLKFFDYPININFRTAFGTPPDLFGRYALGLGFAGQPVYEALRDQNAVFPTQNRPLLNDAPVELDLSGRKRRDIIGQSYGTPGEVFDASVDYTNPNNAPGTSDDAPFATTDLERVLRAFDADSGTLPSRLWDVVDSFDPTKLMTYDPYRVELTARQAFNNASLRISNLADQPFMLAAAQQIAAINRRNVTTDSFSLPVPSVNPPPYMLFPPEYVPGTPLYLRPNLQLSLNSRPPKTVAEMLEVRIRRELKLPTLYDEYDPNGNHDALISPYDTIVNSQDADYVATAAARNLNAARISAIINGGVWYDTANNPVMESGLLSPDLIAGRKMDLNRPFGDGKDNAGDGIDNDGNGVVDEPSEPGDPFVNGVVDDALEAGEPFLDLNGNGKYDDGSVAGVPAEPYIDLDNSGRYSPPIDKLWGQLWPAALGGSGALGEPIAFDYTNGAGVPIHPAVAAASVAPKILPTAVVRNLENQARQLYARHLYCLMLLLVDEGYIAPYDEFDPQIRQYLDTANGSQMAKNILAALNAQSPPPANPQQEARRILLRKLTCQMIAQWAVNCVDMRDSDASMTAFEYDEYPWDGWGCLDRNAVNIPLDGDPATNENGDETLLEADLPTRNFAGVIDWNQLRNGGPKVIDNTLVHVGTDPIVPGPKTSLSQTRGVVWGAERPELLITETFAFHDRRTEDTVNDWTQKNLIGAMNQDETSVAGRTSLDQRLRPRGGLFVELYNPSSPQGQYPAELYSLVDTAPKDENGDPLPNVQFKDRNGDGVFDSKDVMGIELGRLSTFGAREISATDHRLTAAVNLPTGTPTIQRSPVWRLIVVEERPEYRNNDGFDDNENPWGTRIHKKNPADGYYGDKDHFESADPDRGPFGILPTPNNEPYMERAIYFTTDNSDRYNGNTTTDLSQMGQVKPPNPKLRIPSQIPPFGKTGVPKFGNYFIAADVRDAKPGTATNIPDVSIAPIKPGRYAVVGTAGAQYETIESKKTEMLNSVSGLPELDPNDVKGQPRFVTTLSRLFVQSGTTATFSTRDADQKQYLDKTRRIELLPSANPEVQQVFVAGNGGLPLFPIAAAGEPQTVKRDNEVVKLPTGPVDDRFRNIFDANDNGIADPLLIPPCVAVPVANMSASEPLDLYDGRVKALTRTENDEADAKNLARVGHFWNPLAAEGEGAYVKGKAFPADLKSPGPFNEPFDQAPELMRNGTTRNYRTIHLQRLADPTLPWNPLPTLPNGKPNDEYDPKLPVNVYRTIDTASVDLTAYNGASSREPDDTLTKNGAGSVQDLARYLPDQKSTSPPNFASTFGPADKLAFNSTPHRLNFRTSERGWHKLATTPWGGLELIPRELWRQEPENSFDKVPPDVPDAAGVYKNDMAEWREFLAGADPSVVQQARITGLHKRVNDLRIRNKSEFDDDVKAIASGPDPDFGSMPATGKPNETKVPLQPERHQFDIVLKHSLGFQNESFGALTTWADVSQLNLPNAAYGTPLKDRANGANEKFSRTVADDATTTNTFPWLAWFNRPFVSAEELLQVPAMSSSQMLRNYSTINGALALGAQTNPYDGRGIDKTTNDAAEVKERLKYLLAPFGHLLNFFGTADFLAQVRTTDLSGMPFADGNWRFVGAPHFYRIVDYVQVPSRFVGTDDVLTAEVFNDVPGSVDLTTGGDITGPSDPRYFFQPPFNKVSRERDPGQVNINTVTGRHKEGVWTGDYQTQIPAQSWSEVFDGIMQRDHDGNQPNQLGHLGPSWRDVVISRKGYVQFNADVTPLNIATKGSVEKPLPLADQHFPDVYAFGLNPRFPSIVSNPFRSSEAGDLVPLPQMVRHGINASLLRAHHFNRGGTVTWGRPNEDDNKDNSIDEEREAGFGQDQPIYDPNPASPSFGAILPTTPSTAESDIPLFSETFVAPYINGERNPYFYYQPMTRLGNLVTNRSNVYAIWITVGYFEVEPAPNFSDPAVQARFNLSGGSTPAEIAAAQALYNRVYPDGYMLGKEVGSDTGDVHRHRGFYIIDRSEPVGFKPGEDLNVERMIRLRRRIE